MLWEPKDDRQLAARDVRRWDEQRAKDGAESFIAPCCSYEFS